MIQVILYSGPDCSLCDHAKALINPFLGVHIQMREIDITQNFDTKKTYGLRIPVLAREDDQSELSWPFTQQDLVDFLDL